MKKIFTLLTIFLLFFIPLAVGASFDRNLYFGLKRDSNVKQLQEFLISRGLLKGSATGNFSFLTLRAVKKYQESQSILQNGTVGPLTREAINNELAEESSKIDTEIKAESYIAEDISDNSILVQKYSDQVYPIASITKLMNAVITVENIDMDKTVSLNSQMLKPDGYSPSLFLNVIVSVKNLLRASLIQSTNDASEALSYVIGNEKFIGLMNQKAKELNMSNTSYYDAHGLNPNNRSTASDLAKLMAYIYKNHPEILSITKENNFQLPDPTGRLLTFKNVNPLSTYPEFVGVKSGYTPESKQTLASVAMINGKPTTIVVLYSTDRKTDTLKIVDLVKK